MSKTMSQSIGMRVLAMGVFASLAAGGLGFSATAEARVPKDATGTYATACRQIQDDYDAAAKETKKAKTPAAKAKADAHAEAAIKSWYDNYCDDKFGALTIGLVDQSPSGRAAEHVAPVGGVDGSGIGSRGQAGGVDGVGAMQ